MPIRCELWLSEVHREAVEEFRRRHATAVFALLFTDIENSAGLRAALGDVPAVSLIEKHNKMIRDLLGEFYAAQEISTAGDSFFLVFAKPSDAVRFALLAQRRLREFAEKERPDFRVNTGIDLGEVVVEEEIERGTVRDVLGMQVDVAARVTDLATEGRILMTRAVFDNARQILKGEMLPGIGDLSWLSHGLYDLKGFEEPFTVCEVGETGIAPLQPPPDCQSGKRATMIGTEPILGWRPAVEQEVPDTQWVLETKLGEGGFGEVWRARHRQTKFTRVFKFCFRADRLRSLKREMTLFRILKETLGERPDIARLYSVQLEEAPYYLELEDTPGGDLAEWIEARGGFEGRGPGAEGQGVSLELRLDLVAQIATALSAAHSVGIIHKDVKPSNVLIEEGKNGSVHVRLTDFGISQLMDREALDRAGITAAGFTETISAMTELSSRTGTRLYMAPELLAGRAPSIQSDIYSLGVLLYQLIIGDLSQPLTTDWERRIDDPILRDDLRRCFAGEPADRFASAGEIARNLRTLPQRRAALAQQQAAERAQRRRRRFALALATASTALLLLALALGYGLRQALIEKAEAQLQLYYANIGLITKAIEELRFDVARELLASCPKQYRNWEWGRLQYLCNLDLMTLKGHSGAVCCVSFSPDGKYLATGSTDKTVKLWDPETGSEIRTLRGHTGTVCSLAFSADGKRLASGGWDTTAKIWDLESGNETLTIKGEGRLAMIVALSPDGRRIATGEGPTVQVRSTGSTEPITIRDVETGKELLKLNGHYGGMCSIDFSADGRYLASAGGYDQLAKLWDLEAGRELVTFEGHGGYLYDVAISPDGKRVATGGLNSTAKIWDARTGRELQAVRGDSVRVYSVAFSPDGTQLATAFEDNTAKIWDIKTGREIRNLKGHSSLVLSVAFSPDGKRLATASYDAAAKVWDTHRAEDADTLWGQDKLFSLAFSADAKYLATADYDGSAKLWETDAARLRLSLGKSEGPINVVDLSPDGSLLVAGRTNGSAEGWDPASGKRLWTKTAFKNDGVTALAFSPDSRLVAGASGWKFASGYGDNEAKIWNAKTGTLVRTLRGHTDWICSVVFSPKGDRIATASRDSTARLWDPKTGANVLTIRGGSRCVAFSPDGKRIAGPAGSVWDARKGKKLAALQRTDIPYYSIAFSPDGKRLVTGDSGRTARIWDAQNGREILTLTGHRHAVVSAAFSSDGKLLATAGGFDGTAILWRSFPWNEAEYPGTADQPLAERIERYKRDYWKRRITAKRTPPRRIVDVSAYSPGVPVHVKLEIPGRAAASSATVTEHVPEGWAVKTGSEGEGPGVKVEGNAITWGVVPWTSAGVTLEYDAIPPMDGGSYLVAFTDAQVGYQSGYPSQIEATFLRRSSVPVFQYGQFPNPDYVGCQDAHILVYQRDFNAGGCLHLEEGCWNGGTEDHKKTVIRFDLSSVPSTFSLERAELRFFAFGENRGGLRNRHTIYAAPLRKPWGQGSNEHLNGDLARAGEVTFDAARYMQLPWDKPGAMGENDVEDAESSTTVGENWPEWVTLDVTESVRYFLEHPDENYGWKISQDSDPSEEDKKAEYAAGVYMYKSSEAPEAHLRPMLILIPREAVNETQ